MKTNRELTRRMDKLLELYESLSERYLELPDEKKRQLLKIISSNFFYSDSKLSLDVKSAFAALFKFVIFENGSSGGTVLLGGVKRQFRVFVLCFQHKTKTLQPLPPRARTSSRFSSSPSIKHKKRRHLAFFFLNSPRVGLEPTTLRLTAECSAIELPRNNSEVF